MNGRYMNEEEILKGSAAAATQAREAFSIVRPVRQIFNMRPQSEYPAPGNFPSGLHLILGMYDARHHQSCGD